MIYQYDSVKELRNFHEPIISRISKYPDIKTFISDYANSLKLGLQCSSKAVIKEISNYFKPLVGESDNQILNFKFEEEDYLNAASNCHGFADFKEVLQAGDKMDPDFENAVDLMLMGKVQIFKSFISENSHLVSQHSKFGHKAQLIHYCSSNAVEMYRQIVPYKIDELVRFLLDAGADPSQKIPVYGGEFNFLELFMSSAHPKAAGVNESVLSLF